MSFTHIATFLFFLMLFGAFLPHTFGANDTDRLALLAIRSKISHDPQGVTLSWNDSFHYCLWQGVTCGHRHRRVTVLDLSSRGLVGTLSPYIGNLSFLREIHLQNNTLGGRIPSEIGNLLRLHQLSLHNNSLEGEIPSNISQCTNLQVLRLGYNKLVGNIPKAFSSLTMLTALSIHFNNLGGGIPHFIGNLTSIDILSLAGCHLGGSIPNVFHKLRRVRFIGLSENDLTGTIPSSIFNLSLLEALSFGDNKLSGILPKSFGTMLPNLSVLHLGINQFTGTLPPSISNCSQLSTIILSDNNFYGKVEIDFGNLQVLRWLFMGGNNLGNGEDDEMKFLDSLSNSSYFKILDLEGNKLKGVLPNSLGNLSPGFERLVLQDNELYGSLPSSIGNLSSLAKLSLDDNQFTGIIPTTICDLRKLLMLYLVANNVAGQIPDCIGNMSMLTNLELSLNKVEGTIPSSLGNCHKLQFLALFQNNLSGIIPREIFGLTSLSIGLNLGRNHFSGPLPVEVGSLKNLEQLSVSENFLSGKLPSSLSSRTSLEVLELGQNFFQGSIPESLSSLRGLQHLNVSHNNLSGPIPRFLGEIPLETLDIAFNSFEGEVPIKGVFANSSGISVVGNDGLCGGMSILQLRKCSFKSSKKQKKLSVKLMVVILILSTLVGVAMVSFLLFCWCTKKRDDHHPSDGLALKESFLKVSYERLFKATNGFSFESLIGVGGFASVYKGTLDEDGTVVAVKVLNLQHRGGSKSFTTECEALRHARHRNLVKIITLCSSVDFQGNDFKALVYEFMPNGSLDQWLHSGSYQLSLVQRVSIATDVAWAVDYLHQRSHNPIVHCDIKPSNILLDSDMVAHVGDFGLARLLLPELSSIANPSSTSGIRGTIGYAPPEYGVGNEVSIEGDLYSYGIVLLEMVTGRKPTDPLFQEGLTLHKYASMALARQAMEEIVEPTLASNRNGECLISMLKIGVACSMELPQARMAISHVIYHLQLLKEKMLSD